MWHAAPGGLTEQLAGLFEAGTCAGLSDAELLERFRAGRDEGGERAFEAIVGRHGPMVLAICRDALDDPGDVHDAFQAVFLVLARRAGAIRKGGSLGSWLYGVAVRLAARAKADAIRRRIRDRRAQEAAALAGGRPVADPAPAFERDDGAAVIHEEVARLPERLRGPILLCYFEGLTHDEAAARLGWPVGTVRSRLARARDRLRARLTRRGVAAPATIGPLAAWLIAGPSSASATAAALTVPFPAPLARAATRLAAGHPSDVGSWSAGPIGMARGVLRTMMLKKLAVAACAMVSIGVGGVGAFMARGAGAQDAPAPASTARPPGRPAAVAGPPKPPEMSPLLKELIEAARERLKAQQAYYEEGRITIDRFIQASENLARVELLAATGPDRRRAIRQRHADLLKEIERRERAELDVGRGTAADLSEARQERLQAEFDRERDEREEAEKAALLRRVAELERQVEQLQKGRGRE